MGPSITARAHRDPRMGQAARAIREEEVYLEHRAALDATLFEPAGPTLTFELRSGALSLVQGINEGDPPRD